MVLQIEEEKCLKFYRRFGDLGVDILRLANGKRHYKQIAKDLKISSTRVSTILKASSALFLSKKNKAGNYHKFPGVLGFMPKQKSALNDKKDLSNKLDSFSKKKFNPISLTDGGSSAHLQKSTEMAKAYMWLYVTENRYRDLIRKVYKEEQGWWLKKVGEPIRDEVADSIKKYPYDAPKRKDELEYTTLQQICEIITSKKNWNDFSSFLKEDDRKIFGLKFRLVFPFRNATGHCIPLKSDDLKSVSVKFKDVLAMLK